MEQSPANTEPPHAPDDGRVAVPEIAELLHLQRPAAGIAAAVVVVIGLVAALVIPDVLPPNALTGFGVGLVALLAAATAAVILDGRDPVVRGPRHLRRDGHSVLARMAGPDPIDHGAPVLDALQRRLTERDHVSIALTGTGTDASALAEAIGRGAAAAGHTSLVIDLRASGAPGVADVGAGTVRLGEAAELADDRPYAWIGAGADRAAGVAAAAGVARRPPRDLELLLVVAPEAATHTPELLRACDRTFLLVAADTHQRAMVSARLDALERAGGTPEAIVVGGLQIGSGYHQLPRGASDRRDRGDAGGAAAAGATAVGAAASGSSPTTPDTSATPSPSEDDRPVPFAPVPPVAPRTVGGAAPPPPPPTGLDAEPGSGQPPVQATDDGAAPGGDGGPPHVDEVRDPAASSPVRQPTAPPDHDEPADVAAPARVGEPEDADGPETDEPDHDEPEHDEARPPDVEDVADVGDVDHPAHSEDTVEQGPPAAMPEAPPAAPPAAEDEDGPTDPDATGPISPVAFETVDDATDLDATDDDATDDDATDLDATVDDATDLDNATDLDDATDIDGFADGDPLLTTAVLEQLRRGDTEDDVDDG